MCLQPPGRENSRHASSGSSKSLSDISYYFQVNNCRSRQRTHDSEIPFKSRERRRKKKTQLLQIPLLAYFVKCAIGLFSSIAGHWPSISPKEVQAYSLSKGVGDVIVPRHQQQSGDHVVVALIVVQHSVILRRDPWIRCMHGQESGILEAETGHDKKYDVLSYAQINPNIKPR